MISNTPEPGSNSLKNAPKVLDLQHIIPKGENSVVIMHEGQPYLLRVTQSNKLILTK